MRAAVCLALLALVAIAAAAGSPSSEFRAFKQRFNVVYDDEVEEAHRFRVFTRNLRFIAEHNAQKDITYTLGVNRFADLTSEEFAGGRQRVSVDLGRRVAKSPTSRAVDAAAAATVPAAWDWRSQGVVLDVQDETELGSSLPLTAGTVASGAVAIKHGTLSMLQESDLVNCVNCSSLVCEFGWMVVNGMCAGSDSPQSSCQHNSSCVVASFAGVFEAQPGNETTLAAAVATLGLMGAYIDASLPAFQLYSSGVFSSSECSSTELDHTVVVVGYGSLKGAPYWIVQNSWGADWGLDGYMLLARNSGNMCGVASMTSTVFSN